MGGTARWTTDRPRPRHSSIAIDIDIVEVNRDMEYNAAAEAAKVTAAQTNKQSRCWCCTSKGTVCLLGKGPTIASD